MTKRALVFGLSSRGLLGVLAVLGAAFWLNVRVGGPALAVAQVATQQSLDTSPAILPLVLSGGHYVPMPVNGSGNLIVQLSNPSSQIPTAGIALANDAGSSDVLTGAKAYQNVNLDGGASGTQGLIGLPQVTANTTAVCGLAQPLPTGTAAFANGACSATIHSPAGGDAGYALVTCGLANLGFDGGQANCIIID